MREYFFLAIKSRAFKPAPHAPAPGATLDEIARILKTPSADKGGQTLSASSNQLDKTPQTTGASRVDSVQIDMGGASVRKTQGFPRCRTVKWMQISMDDLMKANCTANIQKAQYSCKKSSIVYGNGGRNEYSQG